MMTMIEEEIEEVRVAIGVLDDIVANDHRMQELRRADKLAAIGIIDMTGSEVEALSAREE